MASDDKAFMAEVIADYLAKEPENFALLMEAHQSGSFANMKYYAHKLRSAVQIIGAAVFQERLEQIEHFAGMADNQVNNCFGELPALQQEVILELNQELNILRS